tara:strand:+ start:128 stop:358 length:231 start_codon:yes stop_codon:yes gene_type:complete
MAVVAAEPKAQIQVIAVDLAVAVALIVMLLEVRVLEIHPLHLLQLEDHKEIMVEMQRVMTAVKFILVVAAEPVPLE